MEAQAKRLTSRNSLFKKKEDKNITILFQKKKKQVMGNFNEMKDSSGNESSSAVTYTMLMIMMDEVSM